MQQSDKHPRRHRPGGPAEDHPSDACVVDPVDLLKAEDDEALIHVEQFASAADLVLRRGFSAEAFSAISTELEYIHTALRRHCLKEAQYLFPMLLLHPEGSRQADQWSWHDIWEKVDDLRQRVEDLEDGYIHASLVRELAEGCRHVAEMIRDQILRERQDVLPMVKGVLTTREYRQLRKKLTEHDTP